MVLHKRTVVAVAVVLGAACVLPLCAGGKKDLSDAPVDAAGMEEGINTEETTADEQKEENKLSYLHDMPEGDPVEFHEVWGYVMTDREYEYKPEMPITDLCYFSADLNAYGEIDSIPNVSKVKGFKGRKHLVVTSSGRALTHFAIDPQFGVRDKIVEKLGTAMNQYDGIQIDFEYIPARDGKNFRDFIAAVRKRIGQEKWLTIAVPARTRTISDDIFDYAKIEPLVDRIIIMAYDEHWSTSAPGAIASMDWCERIADYAKTVLPKKKLVMGLPFYGRTWQDTSYGKAWYFSGINRIMNENDMHTIERENGVPYFTFTTEVNVTGYFDDTFSLVKRLRMYAGKDIDRVAFWRIGQEDPSFWDWLVLK